MTYRAGEARRNREQGWKNTVTVTTTEKILVARTCAQVAFAAGAKAAVDSRYQSVRSCGTFQRVLALVPKPSTSALESGAHAHVFTAVIPITISLEGGEP